MRSWRQSGKSLYRSIIRKAHYSLLILGILQVCGDLAGFPTLKAIGAATAASPAPKIFTSVEGLETFSTRFVLEFESKGKWKQVLITPELYARMKGPYNRRNVYCAILAFGPILSTRPETKGMFDSVARYSLCGNAPLLRELGLEAGIKGGVRVRWIPRPGSDTGDLPLVLHVECK